MCQPELGRVLSRNTLGVATEMRVHVNEPGKQIVPFQLHYLVTRLDFYPAIGSNREKNAQISNLSDPVSFD